MTAPRALADRVSRIRDEIAAVESAQGRFDHGPQRVAQTVARVRADMRESDTLRGRGLRGILPDGFILTDTQQRAIGIVGPTVLVTAGVGAWTRSWKQAAISGGLTLAIAGFTSWFFYEAGRPPMTDAQRIQAAQTQATIDRIASRSGTTVG